MEQVDRRPDRAETSAETPLRCSNCRIVLRAVPVVVRDRRYCCAGCSAGGPCQC